MFNINRINECLIPAIIALSISINRVLKRMDTEQLKTLIEALQQQHDASTEKLASRLVSQVSKELKPSEESTKPTSYTSLQPFENFNFKKEKLDAYLDRYENYVAVKGISDLEKKAQLLCASIGADNYNGLAAFLGPQKRVQKLSYKELIKSLKGFLLPKKSVIIAQHSFFQKYQEENQSITEYVAQLQRDLTECEFYLTCTCTEECNESISFAEDLLQVQLIRGLKDNWIHLQLLRSPAIKFEEVLVKA